MTDCPLCGLHRLLIINDHVELAMTIANAGLHVGIDDADDLHALRARLGDSRILGISCYASLDRAKVAQASGANYVAFGSVFPSSTKPAAVRAPLNLFAQARGLHIATVGIGGIAASNLPCLVEAGADAAAVIADLFDVSGCVNQFESERAAIRARAAALSRCFALSRDRAFEEEPQVARPDSCTQAFRS